MDANVVLMIEGFRIDKHALLVVLSGEKAFRKRRPLIGERVVLGNDPEFARLKVALDQFFRGIPGHHAAAQNDCSIFVHVPEHISTGPL